MYQRHGVVHDHGNTLVDRSTHVPRHYCGTRLIRKGFQAARPGVHLPAMSFILFLYDACRCTAAYRISTLEEMCIHHLETTARFASHGIDGTKSCLLFPKRAMMPAVTTYLVFMVQHSHWGACGVVMNRFRRPNQNGSMEGKCADTRQWKPRGRRSKDGSCQCLTIMGMVYEAVVSRFPRRLVQAEKKRSKVIDVV